MKDVIDTTADTTRKKRILVVEDESTTRLFLLNELKKSGLETDTAANANIALKKVKDGHFDAIILDMMLQGVRGQDLIKDIRKHSANIPIFVCTSAQRMEPWRKKGSKAGATKVFDKASPVDAIVSDIVDHLMPKPQTAAKPDPAEKTGTAARPEAAPPARAAESPKPPVQAPASRAPAAVPKEHAAGSRSAFTPLPTGRESTAVAAASATDPASASREQPKTGFFHNPEPAHRPGTNTALLRKAAEAGHAARAAVPSVISGDTPLTIPLEEEASTPRPSAPPPTPPAKSEASAAEPQKERAGLAERIIAPFKIFSSRGGDTRIESNRKVEDLKEQLAEVTRNRDELLVLLRDHPIFGAVAAERAGTEGLEEVKAAAARAEAAYQAELARSKQFEEELKRIREARDELNKKLAREEEAAAESRRRSEELEERLTQSASELNQVKGELQKHISEHSKLEGELRQQLNTARQSADSAKVAYQQEAARAARSADELVALRQARDQLNARLGTETKAAAESKTRSEQREQQLRETAAEVDRLKTELKQQAARGVAQSKLEEKLRAAQAAAQNAEAACKEEADRGARFEHELARLKQAREELNTKFSREEQAAAQARRRSEEMERQLATSAAELQRVKAEMDRHVQERTSLETHLQEQVASANAAAEDARRQYQQETTIFRRSKEEVDALRQARDQMNVQLEREQQAAVQSRRHSQELETKLQQSAQELAHLRAELEKHLNERASLVTASSRQLNAAKAATSKAEKAYQAELKRAAKFEQELAALREDRTQLDGQLKTEQKSTAQSKRKIKELEELAQQHAAELERARKELEHQVSERERLEAEHQKFSAETPTAPVEPGPQAEARFRESISALARATAQLEQERGERRRVEQRVSFLSSQLENLHEELRKHLAVEKESQQRISQFEYQLRDREDGLAQAQSELQQEIAARQLVEAQLKAKGEIGSELQKQFNLLDEARQVFNGAQEKLEGRLQTALSSLTEAQDKLQKEIADRKRVEGSLDEAQRKLQEHSQQSATEIARLQSALQVELIDRRKAESQSMQQRYASLDASRLGRAFVNSFRTNLRPSAESLLQSTRRLLELQLDDEHKKIVEDVLENALFLQTSMQDDAHLPEEKPDTGEAARAA